MESERLLSIKNKFQKIFGGDTADLRFFSAPGRVNLIGEHIDYCGGYVFPAALTLNNIVAVRKTGDRKLKLAATDLEGIFVADLDDIDSGRNLKWGKYQAGIAAELMAMGVEISGAEMLYDATLPFGSGLSFSASIELATGVALTALFTDKDITDPKVLTELAVIGQRCENNYCGVNCGIMDQFASAMGKKDHAVLLNCGTLEYEYVPLELGDHVLVLANTKKKHALGDSKYNERRHEVTIGLELMNAAFGRNAEHLCDYTMADFDEAGITLEKAVPDPIIRKRVKHVISENDRVKEAVEVLKANDLATFGKILHKANDSIRYDYEVTGFELDTMYDEAIKIEGCIGARMTGGGFGGCTVNIVKKDALDHFVSEVMTNYKEKTGITPEFYVCEIGDGAGEIHADFY